MPDDKLEAAALEMAKKIAKKAPLAIRLSKNALNRRASEADWIVMDPEIKGTISIKVVKVPWDQIFDAALLVETGGAKTMDRLVVVYADEAAQLRRIMLRDGIPEAEALQKIRSQMPLSLKVKQAHYVVDNSGTREATERRVREVYQALLADLKVHQAAPA